MIHLDTMTRIKRFQLTLTHGDKLRWLREWMQKDVPAKLTLSQTADATISILHQLANSKTMAVINKDLLYNEMCTNWAKATALAMGPVLARFVTGEITVRIMDGGKSLVVTRLSDGEEETMDGLQPELLEQMARTAAGLGTTTGSMHAN